MKKRNDGLLALIKQELISNPSASWDEIHAKFPAAKYCQYYWQTKGKNKRVLGEVVSANTTLGQVKEEISKNPDITWPELSAKLPEASYNQYYRVFNKAHFGSKGSNKKPTNARKVTQHFILDEMKEAFKSNPNISWNEIHAKIPNSKKHQYFYLRKINGTTGIPSKEKLNAVMHRLFSIPSHNLTSVQISDYKDIIVKTATALDQKVQVVELRDPKELWVCRFTK